MCSIYSTLNPAEYMDLPSDSKLIPGIGHQRNFGADKLIFDTRTSYSFDTSILRDAYDYNIQREKESQIENLKRDVHLQAFLPLQDLPQRV